MRRMDYVAAAAAAMIAPLAIALPAAASTPSPVLTGVSILGDGDDNGDDNGFIDENGDGIDDDFDDGIDDDDFDDDADDATLNVWVAGSTSTGDVSILLAGDDFPDNEDVVLSSPSLADNCSSTDLGEVTTETDRRGHFDLAVNATECEEGTYQIIVTEQDDFTSAIVDVNID